MNNKVSENASLIIHQDLLIMDIIKNNKDIQNVRYNFLNFFNVGEMSPLQMMAKWPLAKCPLAKCPLAKCPDTINYSTFHITNYLNELSIKI